MWLGSSQLLDKVDCRDVLVLGTRVAISDTARDLGVVIDRELSLAANVTAVCRSGYNQLRQLRPVVRLLSMNATKTLLQAFISCRLDYCNSLLYGISDGLLQRLQSVQNAAARLVTGVRRSDHITPVMPVRQRVAYKIAGLMHQSLAGAAPAYLADDWSSYADVSFQRYPEAARATNTQQTWQQEFLGSRSSTVERPSTRTVAAGTFLRFFQTIFENTPLKRLATLSTYRRYTNKYIYLSTSTADPPNPNIYLYIFTRVSYKLRLRPFFSTHSVAIMLTNRCTSLRKTTLRVYIPYINLQLQYKQKQMQC